jgi:hypothetical protein
MFSIQLLKELSIFPGNSIGRANVHSPEMFVPFLPWILIQSGLSDCSTVRTFFGSYGTLRYTPNTATCFRLVDCRFISVYPKNSQWQGGAIYLAPANNAICSLEITSTLFFECQIRPTSSSNSQAQGAGIFSTCQSITTTRTCFDNCASMDEAHAMYSVTSSANDVRTHTLCTFFHCGYFTDGQWTDNRIEGRGTVLMWGTSNYNARLTVENANWTGNRARNDYGSVWFSDIRTTVLAWRFVTCLDNSGPSAFYTYSSPTWGNGRENYRFQYMNVIGCMPTSSGSSYVFYFEQARADFGHCVFSNPQVNFMYRAAVQLSFTDCVFQAQTSFSTSVTLVRVSYGSTATYDPKVSVSVCLLPIGTDSLSPSSGLRPTHAFGVSDNLGKTPGITASTVMDNSRAIGESVEFRNSRLADSESLRRSRAFSGSSNWNETEQVLDSIGFKATEGFKESGIGKSAEIRETGLFEGTLTYSPSPRFSPSHSFTGMKDRYRRGRSVVDVGGYVFFFFFYGDGP